VRSDDFWLFAANAKCRLSPSSYGCIKLEAPVSSVAWGGGDVVLGGAMLCAGSADHSLRIWRIRQREHILHTKLEGHDAPVSSCAFNQTQTRVVSGSHDGTVRVWGWAEGARQLARLEGHLGWVTDVACGLEGGTTAASSSRDGSVRVWDIGSSSSLLELFGHTLWVTSCTFVPQQSGLVVSGGHDKTLRLWDVRSGMEIACLRGHTAPVGGVSAGSGGCIASSSWDGTGIVWSLRQRSEIHRIQLGSGSRGGQGMSASKGLCCSWNDADGAAAGGGGQVAMGVSGGSLRVAQPGSGGVWEETEAAGGGARMEAVAGATPKDDDGAGAEEWLVEALLQHLCSQEVHGQVVSTIDEQCVHWAKGASEKHGMSALRQV
jgi:hypothetical protein